MSNRIKVLQVAKNCTIRIKSIVTITNVKSNKNSTSCKKKNQYFICKKWYKLHKRSNRKINCTIRIKGTNTIANIKSNKIVQVA